MQNKPVYINIFTFAFPVTAIVSILHRLSGAILFFMIPVFLGMLQDTLFYSNGGTNSCKWIIWGILSIFIYHLFAGIRHLCMDAGLGEDKVIARATSYLVLILAVFFSAVIGMRLC